MLFIITFLFSLGSVFAPQKSSKQIPPPGTRFFQENRYLDEEVVKNIHWKEFLYFIKKDSAESYYQSMLPDTSKILNGKNYFNSYEFRLKPLTGISYFQAQEYCKWRSAVVTRNITNPELAVCKSKSCQRENARYDRNYRIIYRLPESDELKTVAGKPKKVKSSELEEMTSKGDLVVINTFTKAATEKPVDPKTAQN